MKNYKPLNINWRGTEYKLMFPDELLKILRIQIRSGERLGLIILSPEQVEQIIEEYNDTE